MNYQHVIQELANAVIEVATEAVTLEDNDVTKASIMNKINDDILVHEVVDGSEYCFNNKHHCKILDNTKNKNALLSECSDGLRNCDNANEVLKKLATWALYADVYEELENLL